jgi:hypothetical protein
MLLLRRTCQFGRCGWQAGSLLAALARIFGKLVELKRTALGLACASRRVCRPLGTVPTGRCCHSALPDADEGKAPLRERHERFRQID